MAVSGSSSGDGWSMVMVVIEGVAVGGGWSVRGRGQRP